MERSSCNPIRLTLELNDIWLLIEFWLIVRRVKLDICGGWIESKV